VPEKDLKFRVSDLYAYCRKDMKRFFTFYAYALCFAIFPALITRICLFDGEARGAIGESG